MTLCDERTQSLQCGLPEGSIFFSQHSYSSRAPLDSSRLGKQKDAISKRQHVSSKNNRFCKGKIQREAAIARRVQIVSEVSTGVNRCEQVGKGVKSFDQVFIPALRQSYQNRCEVLFFLEGESHASQIKPTLRRSYTINTLSKSP